MPDISIIRSPLKNLNNPITYDQGSYYGSKDASLGRFFGNYYDKGLLSYEDQANVRYNNQGSINAFGNFAADLGAKTLAGIPSILGSVGAVAGGTYSALTGDNFTDGFNDNPFLNLSKSISAWGEDMFPHFQEASFNDLGFLDQLKHPGQLGTSNVDSLAFMAQSFGLAGLLSKAQVGARLVNVLAKGKDFSAVFAELAAPNLAKVASTLDAVTLDAFLTTNESAMEAVDSKNSVSDALHNDRLLGKNNMSDKEIEDATAASVNNVFWLNMLTNAGTNLFFTKLVSPLFTPKAVATRANKLGLKVLTSKPGEFVAKEAEKMSGFEKFLFDEGHTAGMWTKALAEQVISEGSEEDLQYSIQKVNDATNLGRSLGESITDYAKDVWNSGLDFSDKDRAKATGLGALLGSASTVLFDGVEAVRGKGEAATYRQNQQEALSKLNQSYTDFTSSSLISKTPDKKGKVTTEQVDGVEKFYNEVEGGEKQEITPQAADRIKVQNNADGAGNYVVPGQYPVENGQVVKDLKKSADFAEAAKIHSELDDLIELETSKSKKDNYKIQLYQLAKLSQLATTAFTTGTTDFLMQKLDTYKKMSPEQLQAAGIEDPKTIDTQVDIWKEHVGRMEKNYLSTANSIIPVVYSKEDQALALKFKEQATLIGNRTVDLDHLIKQVDDGIGTKLQTTKLDPSYMQNIVDVFSSTEDATILFPYRNKIKDTPEKIELADLSVKRRQLQKAREELGTIYSKMLEPNKGFKDYKAAPEGKRTQLYAPKSEKKKELSLHDNFTPEEFDDYIERKSAYLSYAEKIKFSKSSFYSDAINLLRKYLKSKGTNVATATSIQKFLEKIVKEKITMYPDEVQRLIAKVSGFAQIVDAAIVKAEDRKDTINSQISGLEAVGNLGEEYFNLSDEYAELEDEIIPELQNIQAVSNTFAPLLEKVQALEGFNDFPAEQSAFREAAVEELLTGTKRQIEASRFDGETIDPDYTDLRGVKFNITYLETLLDKALKSSREFSGKATEVRKLISNLKKIEKLVKENIADKERKNQKENEYYAQGAVDVLESIPNLPELLSSEQLSKLAELKKENLGLAGAASVDLLASLDKDVSQSVLAKVKMEAFELLNNLKVFQIKTALGKEWGEQHVTRILNSPSKGFQQVYVDLLDKENKVGGAANLTPLANFVKSYDVVTFLSEVSKFEGITSKEELIEIVKLQAKLIALEQISRAIETDSSYMEFYTRVQRYLEASKSEIYPSTAQIRVIRELSLFVDGPVNAAHEMFQNIAALKAPAGAGKSVVVAPALRAISKLDSDEILTAASQKLAADNINKSLGSSNNSSNIEELTALLNANTIPEKVKLIVVDEAGVMNKKELTLLAAAFAKRNRQNPQNSVKMVFLYDPNQITPGNTSFAALDYSAMGEPSKAAKDYHESNDEKIRLQYRLGEKIYSADFSSLPFIENIYNITPLSTTYRSDVSEIVDLQNTFKTTGPVENVNTAATSNPLNNVKDIKGTFVEGGNNIAKVFQSSQEANPSRSRVIIVGSSVKRDDYKKLLPNAEVLTSLEAIGITRDEVYVDILPTDGGYLNSPSVYNDHMYTATSRGVLFVHLSNTRGDFQIDPTIDERLSKTKKDRVGSKKNAIETLKSDIKTLEDITGKVAAPQEETKKETPVALTETEETGDVIEPPSDIVIGGSIDNGFHSLQHPDSNTLTEQGDIPALKAGDEVILVKDISNGQTRYVVLQPINNSDYRRIAILGDNEISSFERNTGLDNIAGLEGYDFELGAFNDPRGQVIKPKDGLILSYKKLFIQPSTKDLTYQYANTSVEDFSGDVDKEGRLVKLSVFTRFLETKWGPNPQDWIANYDEVIANFEKYTKIVSFKKEKEIARWFPDATTDKDRPRTGPPYLVIHGLKSKLNKPIKNQFIRLTPSVLSRKYNNPEFPLESVYEFINKLETFEKLLATSSLPGKYRELTNGGFIEIGTQRYYPFHSLIAALSEANKTKDENFIVQLDADLGNLKSVLPPIPANTISKELLKLANELDVLVHGDITDGEKRNHEGKAQKVMDALGTQNLIVTLPNGINKILRDYRTTKYIKDDAAELTESAGLGLLGPRRMVRRTKKGDTAGKGLAHNPTIKDSLRKRLENYAQNLEKRGLQDTSRYKYVQGALNLEGNAHIEPITTQDLRALFIDGVQNGKFSNISEGFGLRTPMNSQFSLDFYEVQGENQRQNTIKDVLIEGMLETNFVKVIPTKIVVASKKDQDLAEIPIAPKQRELKPIDRLRRELRISKDPISTILARYSAETITEFKGDKSPEAAAKAYQKATTKVDVFSSKNVHNIFQALYNTLSNPIASKEVIEEDIKVSLGVEGIGRDAGKLASRDFIRGSVLTKIFTGISHDDLFLLSDFARTDYYSSSKYAKSKEDFNDTLLEYIDTMNQDVFEVIDRFNQVIAAYNEITKDKIIPIKDISGVYERLQQIVLVSSSIREQERSTADFGIGLPEGYKAFAESLKAAKNEDTFNSILESPRNKDYKTTLEKEAGPHKDWDTAIDAVLERSLLKDSENIQDLGDNLSILEVAELINNITNPGVLGRIARVFSRKKNTELFNIIEYNRLQNSQGKDVWGLYRDGLISLALTKEGRIGSRVVRHETFHKMFWEYLTPGEQALAFNLAKSTFKEQSLEQLEERMAESFETFVATKIPSIFEVLWNKLLRLLGFTINNFGSLNQFFNSIEGGVFSKQQSFQTGIERSANVIGYFSSLQQYQLFKKLLLDTFSILEKERKETGAPAKSYTELVLDSFDRLDLIRNNIDQALDENTPTERNIIKAALDVVLAPAAYKVKKAFVDKFFGQAQTKETMLKLIGEKQLQLINEATARQENLLIKQSTGEDVEQDLLDNDEVLSALKAERFDTELEDPTNKITGAVKQRLISLKYKKGDKEGYVALGEAFSILIDRIASVPITSLDDTLKALSINFQDISPTQSTLGNIRQEVGRFMNSTIANVKNGLNDTKLRKDVTFRKDAQSEHLYVIYSKDGSSVQNITQFEALNPKNKDKYGMLSQHENAPLDSLLKDLVKVIPTKGSVDVYKDMAKAYYFFEDLDFIRSLIAALGSLRSFQSQKGIKSYSYGNFSTRYLRNKTGGGNQIHEAHFNLKFSEYVQNQGAKVFSDGIPKLFSNDFLIEARTAKTVAERTEVAKKLLNLFKLGRTVDKISAPALEALFARINRGALDEMQRIFALKPDKYESLEDYKKARTGDALISGESGIRDAVIDILNTHYQLVETHSFMRGDGKRAYGWIDASFQSSFLQSFVNAIGNKVHRKFANFFVSEGRLKTNDRFLKDNILFSKSSHRATIHGYIDHDSIQWEGDAKRAKYLTKENLLDFEERHVLFGYLARLKATNGNRYFQMLPIPSNRTTIQAVDITLQKGDNVFSALKDIIKAQKNRPSIEENADLREIETYAKNYKEWKLAGLQGSVENMTEKEALEKVKEHVQEQVTKLLPLYAQSEWGKFAPIRIPEEDLTFVANKINAGSIPKAISAETATDEERQAYLDAKKDVIEKILTNFYYNFIINQYSVSQMLYGDETFYTSKEDQTKRLQLATATGDTILTDVNYGIPPQSKVLIVEDLRKTVPSNLQGAVAASFRESLDASDAEGFMLPEFYEKIARTYGIEAVTDIVMKPVYYANENGIPVGIKYSVKVLTDELVKEFPHLKSYREEMRRVGADQMTFKSAMKIGRMKTMGKLDDNGNLPFRSTTEDSLVTLNSEYLRFQLNPSHSTDVDVANPSQLTAQINTNGQNTAESLELHNLSAVIIDNGLKDVTRKLRLTRKGGASPASIEILRKMLLSTLEGISGNDDIVEMLKAIEEQTGKSASLSLPLIADRVVSSIASLISKATVGFRFPGSKLVLQADLGKQKVFDVKSGTYQVRDLQFRDHEGYCEIILPEAYREFLETGDLIHKGLKNGLMGFRIPSTNYHSALPLRVVGFYPAPKGSNANIVIAPSLLVYFHGSDYDVDSLFVIKKSKFTGKDVDLNEIISKYDLEHTYDEALYLEKNISVPGFLENGERSKIGGDLYTHQYLEGVLNKINQQVDAISTKLANKNKTREETKQWVKMLSDLDKDAQTLSEVIDQAAKNQVVDLFSKNMLLDKNRTDLLTPITFESVKGLRLETKKQLESLLENDTFYDDLSKAGLIQLKC